MAYLIKQDAPVNLLDAVRAARSKLNFAKPIKTLEQGKAFIRYLNDAEMMFHFEDDPADIITLSTGKPLFTAAEARLVAKRVADLYALDWPKEYDCPIGYALHVMGHVIED